MKTHPPASVYKPPVCLHGFRADIPPCGVPWVRTIADGRFGLTHPVDLAGCVWKDLQVDENTPQVKMAQLLADGCRNVRSEADRSSETAAILLG